MKIPRKRKRARNERISTARQRRGQDLLEVTVRSRTAHQLRNRRVLVFLSKIALAAAVIAGVYFGARTALSRFFYDNPDYKLSQIEVQTDGSLQRDQILKTADLREGLNIFSVNLSAIQNCLEQLPQVEEAQVLRKMPGEIDIHIVERRPIAWITAEKQISDPFASDAAFLVDARGVLMKQKKLLPEYLGLPLILGCAGEPLVAGRVVESFEAKAALELLRLSTRSFMQTRFQIREIDVSKGYCLLVTDKNHTQVTLGFDDLEAHLQRLEQFLVYADDEKREIETVNLLVQRNIPVTFRKPASAIIDEMKDSDGSDAKKTEARTPQPALPVAAHAPAPKHTPAEQPVHIARAVAVPKPTPMPVRKAVPVQHFMKGTNSRGE